MRLNLGSGQAPIAGYTNVDTHGDPDIQGDIRQLEFSGVDEIVMSHVLEHLPWRETVAVLRRVRSWANPGATLTVEVPDMAAVMAKGAAGTWLIDVYGAQTHEGEYHQAGFTEPSLTEALRDAGWDPTGSRGFHSDVSYRQGLPVIEVTATA